MVKLGILQLLPVPAAITTPKLRSMWKPVDSRCPRHTTGEVGMRSWPGAHGPRSPFNGYTVSAHCLFIQPPVFLVSIHPLVQTSNPCLMLKQTKADKTKLCFGSILVWFDIIIIIAITICYITIIIND